MTTRTATVAPDLPNPCASPVLPRKNVHTAIVAVLVVALLLVAVLALAAMFGLAAELAAFVLLGSWAGIGVIVVMAGLPLLLGMEDRWAHGERHRGLCGTWPNAIPHARTHASDQGVKVDYERQ